MIASGRSEGAKVVLGGGRPADHPTGWYVQPTVLTGVYNDMQIAREEVFGRLSFIAYDDEAEAVRLANDTEFGLAGAVFSSDHDRAYDVARQFELASLPLRIRT